MGEPTIQDVAKKAGVSAATVSRALNDGLVKASTRSRVQAVAQAMGYQPSAGTRKAQSNQSETIGILVTDIGNFYFTDIMKGLFNVAQRAHCRMVIADLDGPEPEATIEQVIGSTQGQVVVAPRLGSQELQEYFDPASTVLVSRRLEGYASVCADDAAGVTQAVRHLASLGHKRIAYVGGSSQSWTNEQRMEAFATSVEEYGLESVILGPFEPSYGGGVNACDALMLEPGVTGAVAFNDLMAAGLLSTLSERQVKVPEELSIVGIDNSVLSRAVRPSLTTVDVRQERLGQAAMQMVVDMLRGEGAHAAGSAEDSANMLIPEILLTRDSTSFAQTQ
ncbi:LacI family transcriptional regulator [Bombiscardovia nodaiensis]|uniref:LacI family transcriptional regulator n=1 Tax=Bombiscardovia nodaiensis TaxID=2932181 RepID=A0ABN6SAX9_9BIFI|nr:LacI family transcriptional regulator [Bombiscardovia nodaiensis]